MTEKKLYVVWNKEWSQIEESSEDLEDLLPSFSEDDMKNYEVREYDFVKSHKLRVVTEEKTYVQKIKKVVLK